MSGADDPRQILTDLPAPLWGALLRALRRAVDRLEPAELPAPLRPFGRWTPEALAADRPRRAVAEALAADPRLREAVGEALDTRGAFEDAADSDIGRLAGAHGAELAAAALVARGRWEDLATMAAGAAERVAARERASAEVDLRREAAEAQAARRRLVEEVAAVREERDVQRRRAEAAAQQLARAAADREQLTERVDELREQVHRLEAELDEERARTRERLARQRRRVEEAETRARVDTDRALRVAAALEELAAKLRAALAPAAPERPVAGHAPPERAAAQVPPPPHAGPEPTAPAERPTGPPVPRDAIGATPGRPCTLPAGLTPEDPLAVRSLLQVEGLAVILDGYNVSMDPRGQRQAALDDQRRWLLRVSAAVAAQYRRRVTVVFDGTDARPGELSAPRGVRVLFTTAEETADERIVALVEDLGADDPVLVVSSDRQVQADCAARGANVAPSGAFLLAAGA